MIKEFELCISLLNDMDIMMSNTLIMHCKKGKTSAESVAMPF
jgi:hypothetical protein